VREADVAGGDAQPDDSMARVGECHQQCERVVDARVGVDQQRDLVGHRGIIGDPARFARAVGIADQAEA
jgi:hypothetical protein